MLLISRHGRNFHGNLRLPEMRIFGHYKEFRDATNSLYRMPIAILSLETAELERSCMIKNLSLSTANEALLENWEIRQGEHVRAN